MMKKDIKWAKNRIKNNLKFEAMNEREIGFKIAMKKALEIINQLDESGVTNEQIIENLQRRDTASVDSVLVHQQNLTTAKKESLVTLKYVDELETLVVPKQLGTWLEDKELGDRSCYFTMIRELEEYWRFLPVPLVEFIYENKKELIEVILGSREYKIEEPKYYALVKGHELIKGKGDWVPKYWNLNETTGYMFISNRDTVRDKYLIEMSKEEWNELGINDSNADFVKIEEEQE